MHLPERCVADGSVDSHGTHSAKATKGPATMIQATFNHAGLVCRPVLFMQLCKHILK